MSALTVRLPDDKHQRLKALAQSRGTTLNRLIDDMTTMMLAEYDAETRFQLGVARGAGKEQRGLGLVTKAQLVAKGGQGKDMDNQAPQENKTGTEGGTEQTFAT